MTSIIVFVAGWLYANFFEYAWHRWILHSGHHSTHNAHHRAFFSGEYETRKLLDDRVLVLAVLHILPIFLLSVHWALVVALSVFSYMGTLEALHGWQHDHPHSRLARWHIEYHRHPRTHYNVFLPFWDYLLGSWRVAVPARLPHGSLGDS